MRTSITHRRAALLVCRAVGSSPRARGGVALLASVPASEPRSTRRPRRPPPPRRRPRPPPRRRTDHDDDPAAHDHHDPAPHHDHDPAPHHDPDGRTDDHVVEHHLVDQHHHDRGARRGGPAGLLVTRRRFGRRRRRMVDRHQDRRRRGRPAGRGRRAHRPGRGLLARHPPHRSRDIHGDGRHTGGATSRCSMAAVGARPRWSARRPWAPRPGAARRPRRRCRPRRWPRPPMRRGTRLTPPRCRRRPTRSCCCWPVTTGSVPNARTRRPPPPRRCDPTRGGAHRAGRPRGSGRVDQLVGRRRARPGSSSPMHRWSRSCRRWGRRRRPPRAAGSGAVGPVDPAPIVTREDAATCDKWRERWQNPRSREPSTS